MFNLFKKKTGSVKVIDKIWMSEEAKWKGIVNEWKQDPELVIITWFDATYRHLQTVFAENGLSPVSLFFSRQVNGPEIAGRKIIFAEHYPLPGKEQDAFGRWKLKEVIVHSAMDEPLFKHFGGDKIIEMMKQLGMKEDGMIMHKMISQAIMNAQEKIEKKVVTETPANSQEEWLQRNLSLKG
ncbi:MAG TPA: hypothetical protein VFI06_16930 [Chitinophagaceae bacterium]|nr:hypothetical protein [Chitinophagaceae bacterium]